MASQQQQVPIEMKQGVQQGAPPPFTPQGPYMQAAPPQPQYQHATPLANLLQVPAPVDCPVCRNRTLTRIEYVSGGFTALIAFAVLGLCCCCIPFFIDGTKNVRHYCGSCNALLATWHRSGHGTDVHAYA
ncbi:b1fe53ec-01a8-48a5-954f-526fd5d92313 [Thermothielavioides terrestris]|uniref:LITAF domain-containing protein n=2 Tax=Thermothielavioides terrestris TaxID=2587410 RepID=G2R6C6_THETT|nr:uncharacterized protein THITE_160751 [Thermothielavioides terrestris NRRL 8126]AEO67611.1 hypothetical protein THITE_160751 [Thermothielavioides terrestris NRRL 8126]SPQ25735.1 b1fe53ec-01a8-48a5-954f-526fd5d92313 [Thermothielavioides terrestris]